jgi:Raf kinase inhibitor-like YbhB/YbcL family protein
MADTFSLSTASFKIGGPIPPHYTCDGQDQSPALQWEHAPTNTKSLLLIMSDPDAPNGTFYHWIIYNLPPTTTQLAEGAHALPPGASIGKNDFGKTQYSGPCPPNGPAHTYHFTIYALDIPTLTFDHPPVAAMVLAAIQGHILGGAELTGQYGKHHD